jgi:hypothetical protein
LIYRDIFPEHPAKQQGHMMIVRKRDEGIVASHGIELRICYEYTNTLIYLGAADYLFSFNNSNPFGNIWIN